jgi:hypothetical protein
MEAQQNQPQITSKTAKLKRLRLITVNNNHLDFEVGHDCVHFGSGVVKSISHVNDTKGRNLVFIDLAPAARHDGGMLTFDLSNALGYFMVAVKDEPK